MSKPYDATTRYLLEEHPAAWPRYFGSDMPWPVSFINADLSTITAEADKVLRVETPDPWLLHVELQASHDRSLPRRLLRYNVLLDLRHELPVWSVAVLLRPEADGPDMTGILRRGIPGEDVHHEFRYQVVRAWQRPVEAVLTGDLGTMPLAPVSDVSPEALPGVIRRMGERLSREAEPQEAAKLWAATYILMGLRYSREFATRLLQGVRDMKESTTYQAILEEGEAKGRAEGKAEGKTEGKTEEARQMLVMIGRKHLGPPSPDVITTIEGIAERERIEELALRVSDVSSWDELLAPPG